MVKTNPSKSTSLEKFHLSFEYDMSWHEAKKAVRERTDRLL
jgi:hypothetical protein